MLQIYWDEPYLYYDLHEQGNWHRYMQANQVLLITALVGVSMLLVASVLKSPGQRTADAQRECLGCFGPRARGGV